jgi:uncharacterized protein (DUF488 family)
MTMPVFSVGYEGRRLHQVVDDLVTAGVEVLVDVRLTPLSRKPGFSKRALSRALEDAGIEYLHFPELGNPRDNRDGFRARTPQAIAAYRAVLESPPARERLSRLRDLTHQRAVALLCFEADPERCHRQEIQHHLTARG